MTRYKNVKEMVDDYKSHSTSLDKDAATYFIQLTMQEMTNPLFPDEMWKELSRMTHIHLAIEKRLHWIYQYSLSKYVITWMTLSFRSIGDCIVFLAVIQEYIHEHPQFKDTELTLSDLSNIIPIGIPSEEYRSIIWDKQKVDMYPDNMIDHHQFYKEIL